MTVSVAVTGDGAGETVAGRCQMVIASGAENVPGPLHAKLSELVGVSVSVTVAISPTNSAPTGATVGNVVANVGSGVVTGKVSAVDANNDPLSYTSTTPTKGTLVFGANGTFTYTPTLEARQAAAVPGADPSTKVDAVTVTVADGYGGTTTVALKLPVTPYGNTAPTNAHSGMYRMSEPDGAH